MKPSTRQRFVALRFDYPAAEVEAGIIAREANVDRELAQRLAQLGVALRRLGRQELEEVCSTRLLVLTARLIHAGLAPREACRAGLAEPLSDDEGTVAALMDLVDVHFA
jgi:nitric oxide reductase NorQ protein